MNNVNQVTITVTTDGELGVVVINEEGREPRTFRVGAENAAEIIRDFKEDMVRKQRYWQTTLIRRAETSKFWSDWCSGLLDAQRELGRELREAK